MLLIARILLLIVLSVVSRDAMSLYVIIFFSFLLQMWLYFTRWVYEHFINNCLEVVFLFNLGLTSMLMLKYRQTPTVIYTSTGIAFVVFIGILLYHVLMCILSTKAGANLKENLTFFHLKINKIVIQLQVHENDEEIELTDNFSHQAEDSEY